MNRDRKKREIKENNIQENEWLEHFTTLLEGTAEKQLGEKRKPDEIQNERYKISAQEIRLAWRMLKKKKAAGFDGIPNEAWL